MKEPKPSTGKPSEERHLSRFGEKEGFVMMKKKK